MWFIIIFLKKINYKTSSVFTVTYAGQNFADDGQEFCRAVRRKFLRSLNKNYFRIFIFFNGILIKTIFFSVFLKKINPAYYWPRKYRYTLESDAGKLNPLTVRQRNQFERNGYLVFKKMIPIDCLNLVKE